MKRTASIVILVSAVLGVNTLLLGQQPRSLEGVWQIERIAPKDGRAENREPLPNLVIFTPEHYSMVWMPGTDAIRSFEQPWFPVDSEKIARFDEVIVHTGTYQREAETLTMTPIVARIPEFMGGTIEWGYQLSSTELVLTFMDEHTFDGVQAPWAGADGGAILTLSRVAQ